MSNRFVFNVLNLLATYLLLILSPTAAAQIHAVIGFNDGTELHETLNTPALLSSNTIQLMNGILVPLERVTRVELPDMVLHVKKVNLDITDISEKPSIGQPVQRIIAADTLLILEKIAGSKISLLQTPGKSNRRYFAEKDHETVELKEYTIIQPDGTYIKKAHYKGVLAVLVDSCDMAKKRIANTELTRASLTEIVEIYTSNCDKTLAYQVPKNRKVIRFGLAAGVTFSKLDINCNCPHQWHEAPFIQGLFNYEGLKIDKQANLNGLSFGLIYTVPLSKSGKLNFEGTILLETYDGTVTVSRSDFLAPYEGSNETKTLSYDLLFVRNHFQLGYTLATYKGLQIIGALGLGFNVQMKSDIDVAFEGYSSRDKELYKTSPRPETASRQKELVISYVSSITFQLGDNIRIIPYYEIAPGGTTYKSTSIDTNFRTARLSLAYLF